MSSLTVGEKLKMRRQKLGLTQKQLADKIGCNKSYIYMLESGRRYNPSKIVLKSLIKALK